MADPVGEVLTLQALLGLTGRDTLGCGVPRRAGVRRAAATETAQEVRARGAESHARRLLLQRAFPPPPAHMNEREPPAPA
ncbi:hypothetical protein [Streptomyces puniciscabiei]|uniref:hypothetical protein n=1 Tax=Streptomyces puniciscabiei TaxID=164348 RepID=UPI00114E7347|nr:hypothetical protein [Streptomyces puniciscabiei]